MSETDFLKLKKHDNVETNTEKFDIENYLNGNWDKINENAKKTNNQILQLETEKTKLEKELKEAQEDFYQNSIRGQASGEYIHVEDSSNCRSIIGIGGNHEQETRSGKNYLNTLAKYKAGEKVTVDGITYIFNEDGSITCNGTATADSVLTFSSNLQTINGSGKKIVGMLTGTQVPKKLSILAYTSDWSKNTFELLSSVNKNITINMQENIDYTIFRIIAYKGTTLNNQTIYYQILDTSVNDLTYEQYGASPSPDYPSKIKTVGSNVNYYNKETEAIGFVLSDGSLQPNNTVWTHSDFIEVNSNEIISITCENKANGQFAIVEYDKNKKFLKHNMGNYVNTEANNKYTITTTGTTKYIIGAYRNNLNMNNIMVVKGAEVLPYNPNCNGMGSVKVTKCNKNIYNKNKEIICNGTGIGSSGELFSRSDQKLLIIPISKLETNIAISFTKTFSYSLRYAFSDKIVENIDCKIFDTGYVENSTTINIKVNKTVQNNKHNYLLLSFTKKDIYPDLQVEYKKEVSQYEEHQEQSYIMPVQKEMLTDDYFDWDNEEEVHVWGNVVVNGTETINKNSNSEFFSITKSMSQFDTSAKGIKQSISNYGTGTTLTLGSGNTNNKYSFNASTIYLDCYNSNINTVEKLKVQLTKNNMKIYAKLATPTRLPFTDEQKAVAKELSNARTYKNVTNITTDSIAILSLDYAKDQETQNQKMQNEIDEIKQLLSTTQTSAMLLDNLQKEVESEVE